MELFRAADGNHKLAFDGYIYCLKSNDSYCVEWICSKDDHILLEDEPECRGRIVTNRQCTELYPCEKPLIQHSHLKDEDSIILLRYRNAIRLAVMQSDKTPAEILALALPKLPYGLQQQLADWQELRKWIYGPDSNRSLTEPYHPKDPDEPKEPDALEGVEPVSSTNEPEKIETSDKFEILSSTRDRLLLVFEGHVYTVWRATSKHIRWQCTKSIREGKYRIRRRCKGAISTDREITVVITSSLTRHYHPTREVDIEILKSRLKLKKTALSCSDCASDIVREYLRNLPEHVREKTKKVNALKASIWRNRRRKHLAEMEPKKPRTDQPSSSSGEVNVKLEFFEAEDENQSQAGPTSSNPGPSHCHLSQQSTSGGSSSSLLPLCDNTNDQSSLSSDHPFIEPEVVIKIKEEPISDDEESILPTPVPCPPPVSTPFKVEKSSDIVSSPFPQSSLPHTASVATAASVAPPMPFTFSSTHQQAASQTPMAAIAPTVQSPIKSSPLPTDSSLPVVLAGSVASTHRDSSSLATETVQQRDSLDTFGQYIAARLRALDRTTQTIAQKMINDILFDAEMGRLKSQESVLSSVP